MQYWKIKVAIAGKKVVYAIKKMLLRPKKKSFMFPASDRPYFKPPTLEFFSIKEDQGENTPEFSTPVRVGCGELLPRMIDFYMWKNLKKIVVKFVFQNFQPSLAILPFCVSISHDRSRILREATMQLFSFNDLLPLRAVTLWESIDLLKQPGTMRCDIFRNYFYNEQLKIFFICF